jgi:hypothetical protein
MENLKFISIGVTLSIFFLNKLKFNFIDFFLGKKFGFYENAKNSFLKNFFNCFW